MTQKHSENGLTDYRLTRQDLDSSGRIYDYNPLDDVTGIHHVPAPRGEPDLDGKDSAEVHTPLAYHFERDALDRLIRKRTDDGVTEYAYDNADNGSTIPTMPKANSSVAGRDLLR
ncbi:hypothetical protein HF257_23445 [Pseudomonas sp. WS 5106]|uniref:YD repeat-containing protein n=1 Tax=Pseudomonas cremoris TaxID=2724178 RepID=A0A7X1AQQ1_9PSED|nr:hypothetical protein [Pseudomonas cremoris]MBC2385058.1 hypothetical protein [Pseudomonas cremoris]MBC2408974.1 hypothetical protein [Pseudomonas cremoris]